MSVVVKRLGGSRCHLPRSRRHCVRWVPRPSSPSKKGAQQPHPSSAHVYCSQTFRWIKMSLGMVVGLGPGHVVLDGHPAPPSPLQKGGTAPFSAHMLWPNAWMDQDATWYRGRPRSRRHRVRWGTQSRRHCVSWGPSSPKRDTAPTFRPMSLVAKRSPISATAEHLFRMPC